MKGNDLAFVWLSKELEYAADKGHVIRLDDAWDRYTTLAAKAGITLPSSFVSRRATFKDKCMHMVGDTMECVQSLKREPSWRHTLQIPKMCAKMALSELVAQGPADKEDDELTLPVYHQQDHVFLSLVHAALMIRADLRETPGYQGLDIGMHDVGVVSQKVCSCFYIFCSEVNDF